MVVAAFFWSLLLSLQGYNTPELSSAVVTSARCDLGEEGTVMGLVTIRQEQGATLATYDLKLSGLVVNQAHGVHVHQYGDLSDMCSGTGSMFNGNGKNFKTLLPCLVILGGFVL